MVQRDYRAFGGDGYPHSRLARWCCSRCFVAAAGRLRKPDVHNHRAVETSVWYGVGNCDRHSELLLRNNVAPLQSNIQYVGGASILLDRILLPEDHHNSATGTVP